MKGAGFYIGPPRSSNEWKAYYELRWRELRSHWGQPVGSERDAGEEVDLHSAIIIDGEVIAAGRAHRVENSIGKVRSMCVEERHQGKGYGRQVLRWLESELAGEGFKTVELSARETAVEFYEKEGYEIFADGELLFGQIPHKLMRKHL
jgi:GNAT superfamily N-acetyltransferase